MKKNNKTYSSGFRTFKIMTCIMIIIMIYYIGATFTSLIITGETREILILETKQYITKQIKAAMCNEILISDEYLTEDRLIRISKLKENRKTLSNKEKQIEEYVEQLDEYKINVENIFAQLKEDNFTYDKKEKNNEDNNVNKAKVNNIEIENAFDKLMTYKSTNAELNNNKKIVETLQKKPDYRYMMNKFFIVDGKTSIDKKIFNPKSLLKVNNKIKKDKTKPQILIYHTHGSEAYANSRKGKKEDTVVGVGKYLHDILVKNYGYNVIHNTASYDVIAGKWNRNAYDTALPNIKKIIKDNPTIEVVIDLHRDSGREKVVSKINNVKVAKVMFFNGVSRTVTENRKELINKNLKSNIAFSMAMQMKSMSMYKDFSKKIYLKGYRYNLHVVPKATLIEVGNNKNTVEEAKNAMVLYAKILNEVLQ